MERAVITSSTHGCLQPSFSHEPSSMAAQRVGSSSFCSMPLMSRKWASLASQRRRVPLAVTAAAAVTQKFTTLSPLGDRLLVKLEPVEEKTSTGLFLPTTSQTKPNNGEVVAVGEGRTIGDKKIAVAIKTGEKVVYSKYAGTEIDFNGLDHVLLKEDDVIGLLSTDDVKDLQPLNSRVLIKVAEAEEKTSGGVLLTDSAKEKPVCGTVVAVGPGDLGEDGNRKPVELSVGSSVLYAKYAGTDFKSPDGSEYIVMRAADVMAVLS